jgi:hypothetical protein
VTEPRGDTRDPLSSIALLVVVILVSGIALGGIAFLLFGDHGDKGTTQATTTGPAGPGLPATETVTETTMAAPPPCHDAPRVDVTSVNLTSTGLTMKAQFSTSCDEGDTLTGSSVVMSAAQGTRDFAAGVFDLDTNPIVMPPNGSVTHTLVFPDGMYWRVPELMQSGAMDVDVSGASHSGNDTAYSDGAATLTAIRAANPGHGTLEGTAGHALQELADYDRSFVASTLDNYWVPQISSKEIGTHADGIVYANSDILRNHLELRQRYQNVKLVSSGDWTTFSGPDFWVSVYGQPYVTGELANSWCDAQGIGVNDCFAKGISDRVGPDGTTVMRH